MKIADKVILEMIYFIFLNLRQGILKIIKFLMQILGKNPYLIFLQRMDSALNIVKIEPSFFEFQN